MFADESSSFSGRRICRGTRLRRGSAFPTTPRRCCSLRKASNDSFPSLQHSHFGCHTVPPLKPDDQRLQTLTCRCPWKTSYLHFKFFSGGKFFYFDLKPGTVYWTVCQGTTRNGAFTQCIFFFNFPKNIYGVSVIRFALQKTVHVDTTFSTYTDEELPLTTT